MEEALHALKDARDEITKLRMLNERHLIRLEAIDDMLMLVRPKKLDTPAYPFHMSPDPMWKIENAIRKLEGDLKK